jgi:hypothetical protein
MHNGWAAATTTQVVSGRMCASLNPKGVRGEQRSRKTTNHFHDQTTIREQNGQMLDLSLIGWVMKSVCKFNFVIDTCDTTV